MTQFVLCRKFLLTSFMFGCTYIIDIIIMKLKQIKVFKNSFRLKENQMLSFI